MSMEGRVWVKALLSALLNHGYDHVRELYNKMDAEDKAIERARIEAEERARRIREAEEARENERRRQNLNNRMDDLERLGDILGGGTGRTVAERAAAGDVGVLDLLRNQDRRNERINRGW